MPNWGYTKKDGPHTWTDIAPAGKGQRQSPIDIQPKNCCYDADLAKSPLKWSYVPTNAKTLVNNGHSAQVTYDSSGSSLEGGPLAHKYQLQQFHLHWGRKPGSGSEHTVDGQMYDAELHLVHWNQEKYASFGDAVAQGDGLCVLGIFLKQKESGEASDHGGFKQMSDLLGKVPYGGDQIDLESAMDPTKLLPGNTSEYWTYLGSLTTPPLLESVTWVVFKEPIQVSKDQMDKLRALYEHKRGETLENEFDGHIIENYRPPLPLGDRVLRASFQ